MKTRVISAIIALLIAIPILITGGLVFKIAIGILTLLGLKEFIDIKETKKPLPNFIKIISFFFVIMILLNIEVDEDFMINMDFRLITGLCLVTFLPVVLYHEREKYSVNDAYYVLASTLFLGVSMSFLDVYRSMGIEYIIYLFLISIITDSYAYFVGCLIGRHKLLEVISPKKTWEGMIGGTLFGVFIPTMYYINFVNVDANVLNVILVTTFLSIVGQFGDLFFSAIKRYYGKKDFSNIMPGHGGILDRFDSIIFIMLAFSFFLTII